MSINRFHVIAAVAGLIAAAPALAQHGSIYPEGSIFLQQATPPSATNARSGSADSRSALAPTAPGGSEPIEAAPSGSSTSAGRSLFGTTSDCAGRSGAMSAGRRGTTTALDCTAPGKTSSAW